jgi:hypothetical protein
MKDTPPQTPQPSHPHSWFLPDLVQVAQGAEPRPAVTLTVGGLLVTGELVDGQTWFAELASRTDAIPADALDPALVSRLKQLLGGFAARYRNPGQGEPASGEPEHLHLRNARVYHPSGSPIPSGEGVLWRVRLSAVDSFSLDLPPIGMELA